MLIFSSMILMSFFAVVPLDDNPFKNMTDQEISLRVNNDLDLSLILMDKLESYGNELINSKLLEKSNLNPDERKELQAMWVNFLRAVLESEEITDIHRYFHFISLVKMPHEHAKSFVISYSLYIKKYELTERIIAQVHDNAATVKLLNEHINRFDRGGFYREMSAHYYYPKTILRINLGRSYLNTMVEFLGKDNDEFAFRFLKRSSEDSYKNLSQHLDETIVNSINVNAGNMEEAIFKSWFPIQKGIAKTMGNTYISARNEKFVTIEQIKEMQKQMQPGDIMLQRRNWYASNIGIPGFWAHAALYTGSLDEMDKYFEEKFPFMEYENMSALIKDKYPVLYKHLNKNSTEGYLMSVFESTEPGVLPNSLEESAHADYVVVLRPGLDKLDKMLAIMRAFENYKKPYDFDFDFDTSDALVCSELIYDAYIETNHKYGINWPFSILNGRKVMVPMDIAKKFRDEYESEEAELEFVYFLDANEESKKAFVSDVDAFIESLDRPKYSFFLD